MRMTKRGEPGRSRPPWVVVSLAVSVFLLGACWGTPNKNVRRVVLISIDTCRADYLSCCGYPLETTPTIDQIAREGVLFTNVLTPVPMTLPAHCSMLCGTLPPAHGVRDNAHYRLSPTNLTLPQILKPQAFFTGAIVSTSMLNAQFGLSPGFDTYDDAFRQPRGAEFGPERSGDEATQVAIEWLEKHHGQAFFLFLHYYDPHMPYEPPEPFASRFAETPYAGEIAYADACIGKFIAKLKELNLYESSLIIIAGDHGEMLGEHGELDHSYFIYQSALRVPLIFKLPDQTTARKIDDLVGLIDIVPTVCGVLGIEPPIELPGVDLSPYFEGKRQPESDRHLYCESLTPTTYGANPLLGLVTDQWKYIRTTRSELYDLRSDPGEAHNLFLERQQVALALEDQLQQILKDTAAEGRTDNRLELDEASRARLQSLGYIGGDIDEGSDLVPDKEDPKDLLQIHTALQNAYRLFHQGRHEEMEAVCRQVLAERPQLRTANLTMAELLAKTDKPAEALRYYDIAIGMGSSTATVFNDRGNVRRMLRDFTGAIADYDEAIRLDPASYQTYINRGSTHAVIGDLRAALADFTQAVELNPQDVTGWIKRGTLLAQSGNITGAVRDFRQCLERLPPDSPLRPQILQVLQRLQQGR
jgi:choline-sulfatase